MQGAEVDRQLEGAQCISDAATAVCPLCLGIMQSLDAGGLSETQRDGGAAVALPDRDAGGGSWLLTTDSSPAGLAASIRWAPLVLYTVAAVCPNPSRLGLTYDGTLGAAQESALGT